MGLDWRCVNFDKNEIDVTQQANRYTGGVTTELKTPASRDLLPMVPELQIVLKEYWQLRGRPEKGLLFVSRRNSNRPLSGDLWRDYYWYRILSWHGIEKCTVHELRHTCISHLIALKVDPLKVQKIARHAKLMTTLGMYVHEFRSDGLEELKTMSRKSEKKLS